jgi:hypothetical protein
VKRSSREEGCFGDYVRAALSTQISNDSNPRTRKTGKLFAGYGYFAWTENSIAPNSAWAYGWGGQLIGWNTDPANNRIVITFSNVGSWTPEVYELAKDWNRLK